MIKDEAIQRSSESTIGELIQALTHSFAQSPTSRLDAQVLLAHITDKSRTWILSHPEVKLSPYQQRRLSETLCKLEDGVPLPYILGHWAFYNLDFIITPSVLIPRPETELLVEKAIQWLHLHPGSRQAADFGTGSGCIAVSLAVNIPDLHISAIDISGPAIAVARANAAKHGVSDQIEFIHKDLLCLQTATFDLICANLPYIPTDILRKLDVFGREPSLALDGGPNGLCLIQALLSRAHQFLSPGGLLLSEIEANQGKSAIELAQTFLSGSEIILHKDYAGHDRLLYIQTQ